MSKIKICGLFRSCDIDAVNEAQPDYIGFVFAKSRRQVDAQTAYSLRSRLRADILPVGVFVNAAIEEICRLFDERIISMAQLHGQEDDAYIRTLKQVSGIPVIKAVRTDAAIEENAVPSADFLLLDNGTGGTGQPFDWDKIPPLQHPYFLAGGINASTIQAAVRLRPYCIDISSGAESDGMKDREKILRLVRAVRDAP